MASGKCAFKALAFGAVPIKKKLAKAVAKMKKAPAQKKKSAPKKAKPLASKAAKKVAKKQVAKSSKSNTKATNKPSKAVKPKLGNKKAPTEIIKGQHKTALTSSTAKGATTISVYKPEVEDSGVVVVEEKRLVLPPPIRKAKPGKKPAPLKPIKAAPAPLIVSEGSENWSAAELKTIRAELAKDLIRLKEELAEVESEMDALIEASGVGAGDDQADAGTKTFEREHEMSLVYNARDMVLQTERALERIDNKSYGRCEDCGNPIGKARLKVFPRATLCMTCKQKEERR